MNKQKLNFKFLMVIALNFFVCFFLTIFALPDNIPVIIDFNQTISKLGSKWIMFLCAIIPTIVGAVILAIKNKDAKFWLTVLFGFFIYQNLLSFIYLSLSNKLAIGNMIEIPFSIFIFLPLFVILLIYGAKIKRAPYKSCWSINFKSMQKTEFIWIQSHMQASRIIMFESLFLFICSIVFAFIKYWWIMLILFALLTIISLILIDVYAKSLVKKYEDMEKRKAKIDEENKKNKSK